jgi:hypothetical protein
MVEMRDRKNDPRVAQMRRWSASTTSGQRAGGPWLLRQILACRRTSDDQAGTALSGGVAGGIRRKHRLPDQSARVS